MKLTGTPSPDDAAIVVRSRLGLEPTEVRRLLTGLCHYVFSVTTADRHKFVVRIATPPTKQLLTSGVYWNEFLRPLGVPLPRIVATSLECAEIEVVRIQAKVSVLPEAGGFGLEYSYADLPAYRTWEAAVLAVLERAQQRMSHSGHPGASYVARARQALSCYGTYFAGVRPVPFLDDTTTKNVLVDQGRLTGVVDVDQLCFGDPLLTVGLTRPLCLLMRMRSTTSTIG